MVKNEYYVPKARFCFLSAVYVYGVVYVYCIHTPYYRVEKDFFFSSAYTLQKQKKVQNQAINLMMMNRSVKRKIYFLELFFNHCNHNT